MKNLIIVATVWTALATQLCAQDWTGFLGTTGTATSQDRVPTEWSETKNIAWRASLPGSGSASPIISGNKIIVLCYIADSKNPKRSVLCFDKTNGKQLWTVEFPIDYTEDRFQGYLTEHGFASNTPVTDGKDVFVFLGKGGVHCVSLDGEKRWSVDVGKESSNRRWGSAASLVLYEDLVIVNASEESRAIIALNKNTGKQEWKQEANMLELTYGTPRIATNPAGEKELVISVPSEIWSLNPSTGKLNWYCETPMTGNVCPSVIIDKEKVYSFGGYRGSGSIAVKTGGKGDVSDSNQLWTSRTSSYVATPVLTGNRFYWINDQGIAFCTSAKDGELIYRSRVGQLSSGRPVYASPVHVGNHIYVVTRRSGTIVYQPGDEYQPTARNVIAGDESDFNATPAVSEGKLYIRSDKALYCISE